jgi:hypothetical protein
LGLQEQQSTQPQTEKKEERKKKLRRQILLVSVSQGLGVFPQGAVGHRELRHSHALTYDF